MHGIYFVLFVILIAYLFDFINGFHDAANAIATIVTTEVLTPTQAVIWAAFFNFISFLFFQLMVAHTIGSDLIDSNIMSVELIFSALMGAIFWNLITWYYGLPSSSTHALIGGLAGSALFQGGSSALKITGFIKVAIGLVISPIIGLLIGFILTYCFTRFVKHKQTTSVKGLFKSLQLASSALLSLTHGANDAQKTMGIIAILLYTQSWLSGPFHIPLWVVISCQAMISLGTLAGGWRIVRTMGTKITKLNTMRGCAAETSTALIICIATQYGVPVSTTQTITGSIAGVGLNAGLHGTRWHVLKRIFIAWILTIPAAGIVSGAIRFIIN